MFAFIIVLGVLLVLLAATATHHRRHALETALHLCHNCGLTHPPFAHFCRRCGAEIGSANRRAA